MAFIAIDFDGWKNYSIDIAILACVKFCWQNILIVQDTATCSDVENSNIVYLIIPFCHHALVDLRSDSIYNSCGFQRKTIQPFILVQWQFRKCGTYILSTMCTRGMWYMRFSLATAVQLIVFWHFFWHPFFFVSA